MSSRCWTQSRISASSSTQAEPGARRDSGRASATCCWACPTSRTRPCRSAATRRTMSEVRVWGEPRRIRLRAQGSRRSRRAARPAGFRDRRARSPARASSVHARAAGAAAPRADPVHARPAHARAWLHGDLCALSGQRRQPARHRPASEIRGRPVRRAQRTGPLSDSHRRSAGHQPRARRDPRGGRPADNAWSRTRPVSAPRPAPTARTRAA